MPLALPVVAVGLFLFLLAAVLAVVMSAAIESSANSIPVIGGYIARGAKAAVNATVGRVVAYGRSFYEAVVGWLVGLTDGVRSLASEAARYAVGQADALDHLAHVTVHEIVKAFVNPVRDLARDAETTATQAVAGVDVLARELGNELHGIEGSVDRKLDQLRDLIRNVDLPVLGHQLGEAIGQVEADAVGRIGHLRDYSDAEFDRLWRSLGRIPLQQILEGLAAAGATAALVTVIADEAGLGRAECRSKVKGICSTDPRAWEQLLGAVVPLLALPSLAALIAAAQHALELALPTVRHYVDSGGEGV